MSVSRINFWIEGDMSTARVISRLLNDVVGQGNCHTRLLETLDWISLVSGLNVFCRVCDSKYSWLPAYLKENGLPYVYYLDDNFWKITGSGELSRHYQSDAVVNALDEFVRGASFVITHSKAMVEFIANRFPDVHCELLPVPFDVSLVRNVSQKLSFQPSQRPVVGYAGGYKEEEFAFLEKVITQLSKERPEIRFEFIGSISDKLRSLNSVQWFPGFSDYAKFLSFKMSRNWTVGLAPLMESEFNAAKTNNKFREYGGCSIPGIYSDTSPYVECVSSEDTGLLVENSVESWVDAIKKLVDDKNLHERIKKEAFAFIDSNYSHDAISCAWKEALKAVPQSRPLKRYSQLRFYFVKRYYVSDCSDVAVALESSNPLSMCQILLKRCFKYLLTKLTLRRIFMICIFLMFGVANFYLIKVGSL